MPCARRNILSIVIYRFTRVTYNLVNVVIQYSKELFHSKPAENKRERSDETRTVSLGT